MCLYKKATGPICLQLSGNWFANLWNTAYIVLTAFIFIRPLLFAVLKCLGFLLKMALYDLTLSLLFYMLGRFLCCSAKEKDQSPILEQEFSVSLIRTENTWLVALKSPGRCLGWLREVLGYCKHFYICILPSLFSFIKIPYLQYRPWDQCGHKWSCQISRQSVLLRYPVTLLLRVRIQVHLKQTNNVVNLSIEIVCVCVYRTNYRLSVLLLMCSLDQAKIWEILFYIFIFPINGRDI